MIYDVAIIGSGVTGASAAWHLSHKECKAALIEKECDCGFGVSKANSGIVHGGFHHPVSSLKAKLEVASIKRFPQLQKELHFPFNKCGIIVAAFSEEELETCKKLFEQGVANGVDNLEWCSAEKLYQLEKKLAPGAIGGFLAPDGGTVEPYSYNFALVESAKKNGVDIFFDAPVEKGEYKNGLWHISIAGSSEKICAKSVVNAAGLYADEISRKFNAEEYKITPRKGEEYLLSKTSPARPDHVLFPVPVKHSKGVLVIPTAGGTTMIGPTAEVIDDKSDDATTANNFNRIISQVKQMVNGISPRDVITSFSGSRPVLESEDFYIDLSKKVPAFIHAAGIQSPGLTASPAVGEYIVSLLEKSGFIFPEKTSPRIPIAERFYAASSSMEQLSSLYEKNAQWTTMVCRCENISEAEIAEAVKKGHCTMDGIKFYTRSTMGRCQGGFCAAKIMRILSKESNIPMEKLTKKGRKSYLLAGKLGDLQVKGLSK